MAVRSPTAAGQDAPSGVLRRAVTPVCDGKTDRRITQRQKGLIDCSANETTLDYLGSMGFVWDIDMFWWLQQYKALRRWARLSPPKIFISDAIALLGSH